MPILAPPPGDGPYLETSLVRAPGQGGQYVGTRPQIMRIAWMDGDAPLVALEMTINGQVSQHRAREAGLAVIDLLLAELRHPPRPKDPALGAT